MLVAMVSTDILCTRPSPNMHDASLIDFLPDARYGLIYNFYLGYRANNE